MARRIILCAVLFVALYNISWATSLVQHIGPVDASLVKSDTMSAADAMAYLVKPDSTYGIVVTKKLFLGDIDGNGTVGPSDVMLLINIVYKGAAKPKVQIMSQVSMKKLPNGQYEILHVFVDSVMSQQ